MSTDPRSRTFYPAAVMARTIRNISTGYPEYTPPKSWKQYEDAFEIALKMLDEPDPVMPTLALPAAKVPGAIREHGVRLAEHRANVEAAGVAAAYAHDSLAIEAQRAVEEIIDLISAGFEASLARFRENLNAPESLTGYESEDEIARYQERLRSANELLMHFGSRISLGQAMKETATANHAYLWCVLEAPTEESTPEELQVWLNVVGCASDIAEMAAVPRFRLFLDQGLPLSIPKLNQVVTRHNTWEDLRNRAMGKVQLTPLGEQYRRAALGLPAAGQGAAA